MRNFLQNLLILFALLLCALVAVQWVRETSLRGVIQALTNSVQIKSEELMKAQATAHRHEEEIQRLDGLRAQLSAMVATNKDEVARLAKTLEKKTRELDHATEQMGVYTDALARDHENLVKQNGIISMLTNEVALLVDAHNLAITNLDLATGRISELAGKWSRMGEELQRQPAAAQRDIAASNFVTVFNDFNEFTGKWNQMQRAFAQSATNLTAAAAHERPD